MSDRKNIAAWTPPGGTYPPYISINDEGDGTVSVTVRRKADAYGGCGNVATIEIPQNAWAGGQGFHGERVVRTSRVGKKLAGALLDGREHREFPRA